MKYLSIIRYVLLAVSVLTVLLYFVGASDVDLMLEWAYVLLGATVAAAVLFPIIGIVQNPKAALRSLVGLVIVAIVLGISFALASDVPLTDSAGNVFDNPMALKLSDTGLFATYVAMTVAILSAILGEICNVFK